MQLIVLLLAHLPGINRNIVECKLPPALVLPASFVELIETLWNVNVYAHPVQIKCIPELIETLWNVN